MNRLATRALIALVQGYRLFFSAWLGAGCRFEPSCSAFALVALRRHGALAGSALTAGRLLRCRPGCAGGYDPVPARRRGASDGCARLAPRCGCLPLSSDGRHLPDVTR